MDIPKKIGRYEILEVLGSGAMGTVYRAKDPSMDRVVALKTIISVVLASQQETEFRERFFREARAAGALAHPGIVPVFDVGEDEGVPFLVMEFINGRTLAAALKKGERMSLDRVCETGQKIAEALGYAHQKGVVHRDIKPANILLTSRETYGIERPKITDFGVAKLAEGQTTLTGQMVGTPAFMPPEQFTGAPIDGRADIFSLGVVLYWLLTGEQPFPGESMTAVSYKVVHTEPVPPRKLNPSLPARIDAIVLKCLAKDPEERYQTGEDLARDLGELRAGSKLVSPANTTTQLPARNIDPDATVMDMSPTATRATVAPAPQQPPVAAPPSGKRSNQLVVVAMIGAVVVAAGGWFAMRSRQKPVSVQEVALPAATMDAAPVPATTTTNAPVEPVTPSTPLPVAPPKKQAPAKSTVATSAKIDPKAEAKLTVAPPPKAPEIAIVDFDPKALDPRQNSRLRIEDDRMPPGLDFSIQMNGKIYLRKSGTDPRKRDDSFFVPPGVHEFRVTAKSGDVEKISNTVSTEFVSRKRKTLRIELRTQGMSGDAGVPQGLYANTQIVVTLK